MLILWQRHRRCWRAGLPPPRCCNSISLLISFYYHCEYHYVTSTQALLEEQVELHEGSSLGRTMMRLMARADEIVAGHAASAPRWPAHVTAAGECQHDACVKANMPIVQVTIIVVVAVAMSARCNTYTYTHIHTTCVWYDIHIYTQIHTASV